MPRVRIAWNLGLVGSAFLAAIVLLTGVSPTTRVLAWFGPTPAPMYPTTPVRRADLNVTVAAGGRVDSEDRTIIECELEATMGASWGSAAILSLVPEGTFVKQGDLLCTLDSSLYEEALRLQEIHVGQARADFNKAELDLDVAELAVVEYRDGLMKQSLEGLKGRIALARSDHERAKDRNQWSLRMLKKGYLSQAQAATEESSLARLKFALGEVETELKMFETWQAPMSLKILDADVSKVRAVLQYQTSRLKVAEERLQFYTEQVEACAIRAPHDGFLVYYTYPQAPDYRIKEGTVVLRTQKLFYLPNLGRMEVTTAIHESVVRDVHPGMKARVEVEGLPGRFIEGVIHSVAPLPAMNWWTDVRYFESVIRLRDVPPGLKPGMSASVELLLEKQDVLVVPSEAVAVDQGRRFCYVAREGALLRREVMLGQSTLDLIEIAEGLEEGESVVLDPDLAPSDVPEGPTLRAVGSGATARSELERGPASRIQDQDALL